MNTTIITGRLGRDPEMRYTPQGHPVTRFSVAVNRPSKEKQTDWFECEAWRKDAEFVGEYVRKGSLVSVRGRMENQKWEDNDGKKRDRWMLIVDRVEILDSKKQEGEDGESIPF